MWVLLSAAPLSAEISQIFCDEGLYVLAGDISADDFENGSGLITVSGTDITIDLDGHTIRDGATHHNAVHGIICSSGSDTVTIRNGTIRDISGYGILIHSGVRCITLENIRFSDCGMGAIATTNSEAPINSLVIKNCDFTTSSTAVPESIIALSNCNTSVIVDCTIHTIESEESDLTAIRIDHCARTLIKHNTIRGIKGHQCTGIAITESVGTTIESCSCYNFITTSTCIGIAVHHSPNSSLRETTLYDIIVSGSGAEAIGFLCTQSDGCSYMNSIVRSLESQGAQSTAYGFRVFNSNRIMMRGCTISRIKTTTSGSDAYGISWVTVSLSSLIDSIIDDTQAAGQGFGMLALNVSESEFNGNQFLNTAGGTIRRGLRIVNGFRNLFTRNIAFRNGTNATEQIEGLASGTTDFNTATGNISTIGSPWTNIRAF